MATCPEVTIQTIRGNECIGDSLPKINFNFNQIKNATCDLVTKVKTINRDINILYDTRNLITVDSTTVKLYYDNISNTLSAVAAFGEDNTNGFISAPEFPLGGDILQYNEFIGNWIPRKLQIEDVENLTVRLSSFVSLPYDMPVLEGGEILRYDSATRSWKTQNLNSALSLFVPSSAFESSLQDLSGPESETINLSGYQVINDGLIMQWGWTYNDGIVDSFPKPFPKQCFSLTANLSGNSFTTSISGGVLVDIISKSQFNVTHGEIPDPSMKILWTAIGN